MSCVFKTAYWASINIGPRATHITWHDHSISGLWSMLLWFKLQVLLQIPVFYVEFCKYCNYEVLDDLCKIICLTLKYQTNIQTYKQTYIWCFCDLLKVFQLSLRGIQTPRWSIYRPMNQELHCKYISMSTILEHTYPLLISADFLKYPFWHSFQTGIKIQL